MQIDWVTMDLLDGAPVTISSDLDMISVRDLSVRCFIGVYDSERQHRQDLQIDIDLFLDTSHAARSGDLSKSVDYALLSQGIEFILEHGHFELLETAADAICHFILKGYKAFSPAVSIAAVTLRLRKPKALPGFAYPALTLHRSAEDKRLQTSFLESQAGLDYIYRSSTHSLAVVEASPLACISFCPKVDVSLAVLKDLKTKETALPSFFIEAGQGEQKTYGKLRLDVKNHKAEQVSWLVLARFSSPLEFGEVGFDFDLVFH